jgi:hypothetical protein
MGQARVVGDATMEEGAGLVVLVRELRDSVLHFRSVRRPLLGSRLPRGLDWLPSCACLPGRRSRPQRPAINQPIPWSSFRANHPGTARARRSSCSSAPGSSLIRSDPLPPPARPRSAVYLADPVPRLDVSSRAPRTRTRSRRAASPLARPTSRPAPDPRRASSVRLPRWEPSP